MSRYRRTSREAHARLLKLYESISLFERARLLQLYALADPSVACDETITEARTEIFERAVQLYKSSVASPLDQAVRPHRRMKGLQALVEWYGGEGGFMTGMGITPEQCMNLGRFFLGEENITLQDRKGAVTSADAMAVMWYRLRNQCTLFDAQNALGYDESKMSTILKEVTFRISGYMECLEHPKWLTEEKRIAYSASISANMCPVPLVIGFIDGFRFDVSRPKENQAAHYSGLTKSHNLLFLAISFPDGTLCVRGPVEGCRNELDALSSVGWHDKTGFQEITQGAFLLGGSTIFECCQGSLPIVTNAGHGTWSDAQANNFSLCSKSVELSLNTLYQLFPLLREWTKFRLCQTYPLYVIKTAFVLAQAHNCLFHNIISNRYKLPPPPLQVIFPGTTL